jgi:hypothetical protein
MAAPAENDGLNQSSGGFGGAVQEGSDVLKRPFDWLHKAILWRVGARPSAFI